MRLLAFAVALLFILPLSVQSVGGLALDGAFEDSARAPPKTESMGEIATTRDSSPAETEALSVADIIGLVNATNMAQSIQELQDFGTRDCLAVNNPEVVSFVEGRMSRSGAPVSRETFDFSGHMLDNVIAEIPGISPGTPDIVIACAHFDSYTGDPMNAPGADDDGSGTAAVMLMAEILAQFSWNSTIRLCAFNAEEVGMVGSKYHVDQAVLRGDPIVAVYNLDMIGYCGSDRLVDVCYTDSAYFPGIDCEWIADTMVAADAKYGLDVEPRKLYVGILAKSDHYPFWLNGYEGVFIIEKEDLDYPYYHKTTDTVDKLDLPYAAEVAKVTMAALCELAGPNPSGDTKGPSHSHEVPSAGSLTPQVDEVSVYVTDPLGIDPSTIVLAVDGSPVAHSLSPVVFGQRVSVPASFEDGTTHTARIRARDDSGNILDWNWTFTIESIPPEAPANLTVDVSGNNIILSWDPSPSPDVAEYRVFKASLPGAFNWAAPSAILAAGPYSSVNDAGSLGVKFYAVRAVDTAGNMDADPVIVGKNTLRPNLGQTLLGNPFVLHEPDPPAAFHLMTAYWTDAAAYDASSGEWLTRSKSAPAWLGGLRELAPGAGFWLNSTASFQKLCLCGDARLNASISLRQGWNLVAFPGYAPAPVASALAGLPWDMVMWGDPTSAPYRLSAMTGTDYMTVGWGYWVHVTADCVWTYDNS